ncbi:MAG: hypothetical protein AB1497_12555 [Bacillota bacterium]
MPKYLLSRGRVTQPTILRVEMNSAMFLVDAPMSRRDFARGKAMNPGIKVTEPITDVRDEPSKPEFFPVTAPILSEEIKVKARPIIPSTARKSGRMLRKAFFAFEKAWTVAWRLRA